MQRIEARGALESAHRVRQICGQILRFAVASGMVDRDVSADLKGALTTPQKTNYAAITDPKRAAKLMRAIDGYQDHPYAVATLKLSVHGFRAMARTILDEVLKERVDLIEHQLAHAVNDPNGRAYNRTAHLPARKLIMQRWADYLERIARATTSA